MRGERERACLDTIQKSVFYDKDGNLRKDREGKSYQEVSEDQFLKKYVLYSDIDFHFLFGLTQEDYIEVLNILRKAKENEDVSKFPDFVFDNGFIEHFQITSSRETKKGAEQLKQEKEFEKEFKQKQQEFMKMCEAEPSFDKVRSCSSSMELPPHNYQNLTKSVKSNFEHHLKSLENYTGNKEIGIFLIESSELALNMVENIYKDWKSGISPGDLRKQQYFSCYRLSRDKDLLNYFYGFKSKLKYIFYCYTDYEQDERQKDFAFDLGKPVKKYEIIKVENIPYLIKLLPWDFIMVSLSGKIVSSTYNISSKA